MTRVCCAALETDPGDLQQSKHVHGGTAAAATTHEGHPGTELVSLGASCCFNYASASTNLAQPKQGFVGFLCLGGGWCYGQCIIMVIIK